MAATVTGKNRLVYDVYSGNSVERCDALWADIADQRGFMSQKAIETMDNFVLGHRMREWKPEKHTARPRSGAEGSSSYCYMYFDQKHGVVDPALQGQTCDAANPMFQQDVVKRVFVDNDRDHSHVLPYAKCVVEVDTNKARGAQGTSNLDAFWKDFGKTQCEEVYKQYVQTYNVRKDVLAACNAELSEYRRLVPLYEAQQGKYQIAAATQVQLQTLFARSNCAFLGGDACASSDTMGSLTLQKNQYASLNTYFQRLSNSNALTTTELSGLLQANNQYISDIDGFKGRIAQATSNIYSCCNVSLPPARTALEAAQQDEADLAEGVASLTQRLNSCLSSCNALVPKLQSKENENINYEGVNEQLTHQYQICEQKTSYVKEKVAAATEELGVTRSKLKICLSNASSLFAQERVLSQSYNSLKSERDDWLRKCQVQQQTIYTNAIESITDMNATTLSDAKTRCGNPVTEINELQELFRIKNESQKRLSDAQALPSITPMMCDSAEMAGKVQSSCCKIREP